MEYYYDIEVNFYDYPINYYEWEKSDNVERILKMKVIRLEDISDIIKYKVEVDLEDGKYIFSDTINSIAVEVLNKRVCYLSYLKYDDDNYVCSLASKLSVSDIYIKCIKERVIPKTLRCDELIQKLLINLVSNCNDDLIKYIYYDIKGKINNNIDKSRLYLIKDISNNFNDKYFELYERLMDK